MTTKATLQAGQELTALKQVSVDDLQKGRTYVYVTQLFVGMFEGFILIAIVMTWIYHFNTSKTLVLISLFHIPLVGTFILSVIVIPIYWKFWTKSREKGGGGVKHGQRLMLAYVLLQVANLGVSVASLAWRVVLFRQGCAATLLADECLNDGFRTVEIAFLTIDSGSILFALIGFIMGILIRAYLGQIAGRSVKVTKIFTDKSGNPTGIETAEGSKPSRASSNGGVRSRLQTVNPTSASAPLHHTIDIPQYASSHLPSQAQSYGNDTISFKFL